MQRPYRPDAIVEKAAEEYLSMYRAVPPKNTVRILTGEEVIKLNRDGHLRGSDPDGFFIQLFAFNDKQNKAADPEPFKFARSALERIAKTAIGRPWIVHPDGSKHVRGASNDPKEIIKFQKSWAREEIVSAWLNQASNNVHAVARVFPEYVPDVRYGRIPRSPYVSPLIYVKKQVGNEITDAEVLHLQSVDSPGYDPAIAKINGMCQGMLGECMQELRALGAAGKLRLSQFEDSLMDSVSRDLKEDVLAAAELSDREQPSMAQRNAATIADFEIRVGKISSDQRARRVAELMNSGEDLKALANYLQGLILKMKNGGNTIGASGEEPVDYLAVYQAAQESVRGRSRTVGASSRRSSDIAVLHGESAEETDHFSAYESIRESMWDRNQSGIVPRKKR